MIIFGFVKVCYILAFAERSRHQLFFFIKRFESKIMMTVDDDYDGGNDMQEDLFSNHKLQIDFFYG